MATGEEPIFQCARDVLWVILEQPSPTLKDLAEVLDRLAVVYANTPAGEFTDNAADRPREDLRKLIAPRFALRLYPDVDPTDFDRTYLVGDGIDDLIDIAEQMKELLWICDQLSADDALYELHLLAFHWMGHVRDLSRYLHVLRYGSPFHEVSDQG
ncbi:hypothetical protein VW23_024475 [Devosia insulae DS-56]|uniref:DUF5063 domain-containing protein n=1 Tax=Devosia insulae DS-56 TaxID=1116389 RepID=A0A1E5XMB0_9HYPH|nr:hypothetical protein [Devosia insulae]OEO29721.1 hypothetical protein VW23_024475 [Devosia insulae DS-56]